MLQFEDDWRYDSPGPVGPETIRRLRELIERISGQGQRKAILEHFKLKFSAAAGVAYSYSSNADWASTDLDWMMKAAAENAPLLIEAFFDSCEDLGSTEGMVVPTVDRLNRVLADTGAGYQIRPPNLIALRVHIPIAVPDQPSSLDDEANVLIREALEASHRALEAGNGRQAVQEVLWLLETIATAFRNPDDDHETIQGRYFNKIIPELRQRGRIHQEQILQWMMTLHGYLSSPTGGGVRHGLDLKEGVPVEVNEARLYCDLIRSYLTFLIGEHERMSRSR